mmetsp:Transcript_49804/g.159149  ORF Transcript_49804/g.159149 Transcript_49804/m.159149 type:complete len:242 (-) Transcript_49804:71-796(-)
MDIGLESVLDRRRREVPVEGVEAVLLLPRHDVPPRRCGSPPQSLRGPTRADRRHAAPRPLLQAVQCRQRLQPPRHLHELGLTTPLQELPVAPPEAVSEVSRSAGELEDDYLEGVPEGDDLACNEGDADGPTGRVPRVHQVHAVHDEEVPEEHAEVEAVVVVVHVRPEEGVRGQGEDRHEHPEGHVLAAARREGHLSFLGGESGAISLGCGLPWSPPRLRPLGARIAARRARLPHPSLMGDG